MDFDEDIQKTPYMTYDISKRRSQMQRPTSFSDQPALILEEVMPNRELEKKYIMSVRMNRGVQAGDMISACSVNTARKELVCQGMSHTEGGWPRDVNPDDPEQKSRYRKKFEKDDDFLYKTRQLVIQTEKYVKQNNCINIFEEYFEEEDSITSIKPTQVGSIAVFKDPISNQNDRSINKVCWSPQGDKVAMAFCNTEYLAYYDRNIDSRSLVYDVSNPLHPIMKLTPHSPLMTLQYNKREHNILVGGTLSGHLVMIDTRQGNSPVNVVEIPDSRGDPVTDLTWLNTKSGSEILATCGDGRVLKWDSRTNNIPSVSVDTNLDLRPDEPKHGLTSICFDHNVPQRYLVATDLGTVMSCGIKTDSVLSQYNGGHYGTLFNVHRNPLFNKIFLTTGDRSMRIWSEDVKSSSIIANTFSCQVTCARWSHHRPSVIVSGRDDGQVLIWDLMYHHNTPTVSIKIADQSLTDIKFNPEGNLVLASTVSGLNILFRGILSECFLV